MARKAKPPPSTLVFSAAEWVPLPEALLGPRARSGRATWRGAISPSTSAADDCQRRCIAGAIRAPQTDVLEKPDDCRDIMCRASPTRLLPRARASSWRARRSANSIRPILRLPARCRRLPTRSGAAAGLSSMIGIRSAARSHADASTRLVASRSPKMKASSLTTCLYGAKSNSAASPPPAQCVRPSERCVRRSARGRRRQRSGRGNFWHLLAFAG